MQTETSEKPGHFGTTVATVSVVFLLLFGPLMIALGERLCFGTNHFERALDDVGLLTFYARIYEVTGIFEIVKSLLGF